MQLTTKRLAAAAAVALSALTASAVQAQGPGGPTPQQRQQQMQAAQEKVYKELGITNVQKTKLDSIQKDYMSKIQARVTAYRQKNPNGTPQEAMAEVRPIAEEMNKKMMAVLTPAQKEKLKKMEAEQMKKVQENEKPR